ncbi:MAG: TfpX/TfpZ family type IV pilin accessory protein [Ramlibacter sp.]
MTQWKERFVAAAIHFGLSLSIAGLAALLVFGLWYPYPYREISGGRELFLIVVAVDVILGPLITFVIFNRKKPMRELRRDLAVVVLIQLSALGYGLWTVFIARPVHLVFEIDRFRVVHAIDIDEELLKKKPAGIDAMPLLGPTMLAVRPFRDSNESADATLAALRGADLGARPDLWQTWDEGKSRALAAAKPVSQLKARFPARSAEIDSVLKDARIAKPESVLYLPLVGRKSFWTAFVDPVNADVIGFMPLDSF